MLTPRENFIRYFKNEPTEWMPSGTDYLQFAPEEVSENVSRAFISQQKPFPLRNMADAVSSASTGFMCPP